MAETRHFPLGLRLGLALSGTSLTVLLMQTGNKWSFLITALLSLVLLLVLMLRSRLPEALLTFPGKGTTLVAAIMAVSYVYFAKSTFYSTCAGWMWKIALRLGSASPETLIRLVPWVVALLALPMAFCYLLWVLEFFRKLGLRLWRESDYTERFFLLAAGLILAMLIVFSYLCTQAFYGAHVNGEWYNFDLIYSSDSGYLIHQDVYRNIGAEQNDLRQPLFGVFAMPFAQLTWLVAWGLGKLLPFWENPYLVLWQIVQCWLYLVGVILLSRLMELRGPGKALFLVLLAVCFPTLIFSLTAEQYLVAVFYLLLLLYLRKVPLDGKLCYVGATGCLLTSGIWFPLLTWDRDFRKFVRNTLALCGVFFGVMILSGRLTTFLDIPGYIAFYKPYAGGSVDALSKLRQYVNFAGACLVVPRSGVDFVTLGHAIWMMEPVETWSPVGIVVLGMSLGGILVGWKKPMTRLCAVWIGFSFLLLGVIGWGTIDNGLMLYSLYFGWAFAAMCYQLICWVLDRALGRMPMVRTAVLLVLLVGLLLVNVYGLREVLVFGTQYYPALGGIG